MAGCGSGVEFNPWTYNKKGGADRTAELVNMST